MYSSLKFWGLVALVTLVCVGCGGKDSSSSQGQDEATKPPPQVRVGQLPTPTALPVTPIEAATSTPESAAEPVQVFIDPPPDEYAISSDVEAMMDDLDRGIRKLDNELK